MVVHGKPISVDLVYHIEPCTYHLSGTLLPIFVDVLVCMVDITPRGEQQTALANF